MSSGIPSFAVYSLLLIGPIVDKHDIPPLQI